MSAGLGLTTVATPQAASAPLSGSFMLSHSGTSSGAIEVPKRGLDIRRVQVGDAYIACIHVDIEDTNICLYYIYVYAV